MNINKSEIANRISGNRATISSFLKKLSNSQDGNIWMINGPKGIGKSYLVKLITSNLLAIKYEEPVDAFLDTLSRLNLDRLNEDLDSYEEKLSFWINIYNSLVQYKLLLDSNSFKNMDLTAFTQK